MHVKLLKHNLSNRLIDPFSVSIEYTCNDLSKEHYVYSSYMSMVPSIDVYDIVYKTVKSSENDYRFIDPHENYHLDHQNKEPH